MKVEDVKKLADLARIEMSEDEMATIAKDFDHILAYVGQVQEALKLNENTFIDKKSEGDMMHNVMREDIAVNKPGEYTDKILQETPKTEDGYLKVKQIL
ncbi:MAG TPA: Asp-tRNA(Asn)/Glu-tRNA(Gln) amidotransferase subunit GatC [Candidatus Paceibacterota bacterium]|nr:Asp-tRNA(Asn)/Glu-tRNA(Gln) amidotransferase subunit GatC [Candidatus Paceibacterota bacterium]